MDRKRARELFWFDNETLRVFFWGLVFFAALFRIVGLVLFAGAIGVGAFFGGAWWQVPLALVVLYGASLLSKVIPYTAAKAAGF